MNFQESVSSSLLSQFSEWITQEIGISFSEKNKDEFLQRIKLATLAFGFSTIEALMAHFLSSSTPEQLRKLAEHLTVGETYFFRDPISFQLFQYKLVPLLLQRHQSDFHLRIWSAGCCTGEEAYSIAIALEQALPPSEPWRVTIIATDINERFLEKASQGIYRSWSFRNNHPLLQQNYFQQKTPGFFKINERFKKNIQFIPFNLIQQPFSSLLPPQTHFDIIFCRNVLMYFSLEQRLHVLKKFRDILTEEGWLLIAPAELSSHFDVFFTPIKYSESILYQKTNSLPFSQSANFAIPLTEKPLYFQTITEKTNFLDIPSTAPSETFHSETLQNLEPIEHHFVEKPKILIFPSLEQTQLLANQGRITEALHLCDQALHQDSFHLEFLLLKANLFESQKQVEETIRVLKQILYIQPNFAYVHFRLGALFRQQKKEELAEKFFQKAIQLLNALRPEEIILKSEQLTAKMLLESIYSRKLLREGGSLGND